MRAERRPHPRLLTWYLLQSLATGPLFPFIMVPRYFRYHTLRYEFDEEGVTMRWGILFRREVSLTYERIQDLHLVSNVIERWLGLGRIQVQTASGSAEAEMTIEGLQDYEDLRDRLYSRMRGARSQQPRQVEGGATDAAGLQQAVAAIREAAAELRAIRERLDGRAP
jgi:putative membrane protein